MSPNAPDISVILPVFNGEPFLADALRSVLEQSHENFELLVFDDGSTDGSFEIVRSFADIDDRVRCFTRPNRGLVATLNELIGWSRGPFLARMDADDVCLPGRFAKQLDFMWTHPDVACVGGSVLFIDGLGHELGRAAALLDNEAIQAAALCGRSPICHPAAMMRTEAVRAIGGYLPMAFPAEDLDLFLRLGEIAKLANLPDDVLAYRQHGGSVSLQQGEAVIDAARRACLSAAQRRGHATRFAPPTSVAGVISPEGITSPVAHNLIRASAG